MINNLEGILAGSRKSYVLAKMGNFVLRGVLALGVLSYNGCASGEHRCEHRGSRTNRVFPVCGNERIVYVHASWPVG